MSEHERALQKLVQILNDAAIPFDEKYTDLLDKIGDSRFVLIGEATHGTHEFYQARIELTKQLITKKGFMAVAIEGDWPDAYRIHRYVRGMGGKDEYELALSEFKRFPMWMWRNTTIPPFLKWLRSYNDRLLPLENKVGFYGLDLYSMYKSMQAVIDYLFRVDPEAAERARRRYSCFDHVKDPDPQTYGYLTTKGLKKTCVKESVEQLLEMQQHALDYIHQEEVGSEDEFFYATQNARLVKNAENYYRSLFEGRISSWNVRDSHMAETLDILADHLENRSKKPAKIIVWAHNSHVGDARVTEMGEEGEINLGQLVREKHDNDTYLIGFSTYEGTVTAASHWGESPERKTINPGYAGSYEELFHHLQYKNFLLDLHKKELENYLNIPRLQRAIGVVYRPESERDSHYFFTRLPYQFDCIIHFDQTSAVEPLDLVTV